MFGRSQAFLNTLNLIYIYILSTMSSCMESRFIYINLVSIVVYSNLINPLLLKSCKSQQVFRSDAGDRAWPSMEGGPVFKLALKRSRALACCGSTGMVFGARMKAVHTCGPTNSRCPARLGSHLRSGLRMAGWTRTWTWAPAISISILAPVGRWRNAYSQASWPGRSA